MGILNNPRKTCILLKHRFRKIIGVALGIINGGMLQNVGFFQDQQKRASCKTPGKRVFC